MRLSYKDVQERILGKIDAGYLDTSWYTKAQETFHKNLVQMISEGSYTESEVFGLIKEVSITVTTETPLAILGNITIDNETISVLSVVRIDDPEKVFRFNLVDYDEYSKRVVYNTMNINDRTQYYTIKGNSIYMIGSVALGGSGTANNVFTLTYVSDLPGWVDVDYVTDTLNLPIVLRAIDKASAEILEIYNRSF